MIRKLNYSEPAVLHGIVLAVLTLCAALGVVSSDDVEGATEKLLPAVALLVPLVQAIWTRFKVWSPKTVDDLRGRHAAPGA